MAKNREELMDVRKQMICQMEQSLHESWSSEEDSMFYYHRSEDRIVLSGDMDEELVNAFLDDMDFVGNRVKCRKIEGMLLKLMKMVKGEMKSLSQRGGQVPVRKGRKNLSDK